MSPIPAAEPAHFAVEDLPDAAGVVVTFATAFLNYATSETLSADVKELCRARVAQGARLVVVDLTAVLVMDSCGLSMLVAMKKATEEGGARLRLVGLAPMIHRLFVVTKVDRVFDIFEDRRAALAA